MDRQMANEMRARSMLNNPLMHSPAAREAWRQQRSFEEDRRRFDASEARFREAERNRHAEEGFRDETARMTAHGQYLNERGRDAAAAASQTFRNETERRDSSAKWAEAEAARKAQQGLAATAERNRHEEAGWTADAADDAERNRHEEAGWAADALDGSFDGAISPDGLRRWDARRRRWVPVGSGADGGAPAGGPPALGAGGPSAGRQTHL